MRRSSLFVGILSLLHATDLWCHCEDDEITLLQLNTRVQAETLPSVGGLRAKSALESARLMSHPGAEALLESVRHLAGQATSESPEVVNTAIEAVKAALAQMQPQITDEHDLAQLQIQRQLQEIQACHSSEVHGATVVGNLVTEISTIQDCRNAVASDLAVQARDCNAWETHTEVLPFPECVTTGSGSEEVYDRILHLRDWANDAWNTAEEMRGRCLRANAIHDATEASCRPEIDRYDESYCQHSLSCGLLTSCHEHEVLIYSSLSTNTLAGQNSRQEQWRILIQADCILDFITGGVNSNATVGDANMSSCDDGIDVSHLTLAFPRPEHWPGCGMTHSEGDPQCPEVTLPGGWDDVSEPAWQLIAHQAVPAWFHRSAKDTFNFNEGDPSASAFMNIGTLTPSDFSANGMYHLRLIYGVVNEGRSEYNDGPALNGGSQEFEWTQTSWITDDAVTGYEPITADGLDGSSRSTAVFQGLAASPCFSAVLDGSHRIGAAWQSVGTVAGSWQGGRIPAFKGGAAQTMSLYIDR